VAFFTSKNGQYSAKKAGASATYVQVVLSSARRKKGGKRWRLSVWKNL